MVSVTLLIPTKIDIATIQFWFELDDYLSSTLLDAGRKKLAEIDEGAPAFIREMFWKSGNLVFEIDPATGILKNWQVPTPEILERDMPGGGSADSIHLFSKVRDGFFYRFLNAERQVLVEQTGDYVPGFMPGEHYGDYVDLEIELTTGKVRGWNVDADDLQQASQGQYVKLIWPPKAI